MEKLNPGVGISEAVADFNDDLRTVDDPARPGRNKPEVRENLSEHPQTGSTQKKTTVVVQIKDGGLR